MTSLLDIASVKNIDIKYKNLLYGFIRKSERELLSIHENDIFYCVPELITITCLLFYDIGQVFCDVSEKLILSGADKNTITNASTDDAWDNSAYGHQWIDSNI